MQISQQIELANSQIPFNINNSTDLKNSSATKKTTEETPNYVSIASCVYEHIITNPNFTYSEKLYYFTVDADSIINLYYQKNRFSALSAKDWAEKIACSASKINTLQKSLKKKKYFDVFTQKNYLGQYNPNLITPTIPNKHIQALHEAPNISNLPNLNIDSIAKTLSHSEFKRFIFDKSKFYIKLDFCLFNKIAADSDLLDFDKIIFLDFYMNSYKKFFASIGRDSSFTFTTKELMVRYSCSSSHLSKALKRLREANYINCKNSKLKSKSEDNNNNININNRKDHYIWISSVNYDFSKLLANLKNSVNKNSSENAQFSLNSKGFSWFSYSGGAFSYSVNYRINKDSLNYNSNRYSINLENTDNNIDTCTKKILKNSSDSKYLNYLSEFYKNKNYIKNPFIDLTKKIIKEQETELKPTIEATTNQLPKQEKIKEKPKEQVRNKQEVNKNCSKNSTQVRIQKAKERAKSILEYRPLSEEQVEILQIKSGRYFDANYMDEVLKKLGRDKPNHRFKREEDFIKYMSIVLKKELHESAKVNRTGFKLKSNIEAQERILKENSISVDLPKEVKEEQYKILSEQRTEENQAPKTDWCKIKENVLKACGNTSSREEIAAMLSKIEAEEYKETKTIKLKISSNYVRKQVERKYGNYIGSDIEKYAKAAGYEEIIISEWKK